MADREKVPLASAASVQLAMGEKGTIYYVSDSLPQGQRHARNHYWSRLSRHLMLVALALYAVCSTFGLIPSLIARQLAFLPSARLSSSLDSSTGSASSSASKFTPILPPSYPLAVRNPYISTWLPGSAAQNLPHATPQFWSGQHLGWVVLARVNNKTYSLFGVPHDAGFVSEAARVVSGDFTSTHTTFELDAGDVRFTLDFFSPVSPKNYLRQSLPFSYLKVSAKNRGKGNPSIQIYSDIDERWTGQTGSAAYRLDVQKDVHAYQIHVPNAGVYQENWDMAVWGEVVWAASNKTHPLFASSGPASAIRGEFARDGYLRNMLANWERRGNGFPLQHYVTAYAQDLGTVKRKASTTFAVGHVRKRAINYLDDPQTHYYRHKYPLTMDAMTHFFDDYEDAAAESRKLDAYIEKEGRAVAGQKYADILALSVRQVYGGIDITIPYDSLDLNKTFVFIKECSSNGNINTMDVIYPAFPIFYLLNPETLRHMLEPLLLYTTSGIYTEPFMIHDLGFNYPHAIGHPQMHEEKMPLEETGNLLILALAYTRASNDTAFVDRYFDKLQSYADYLVSNGLYPELQLSTNDAMGSIANQTNLAIKSAIGLTAWGALTNQVYYSAIGKAFAREIQTIGTNSKHNYFKIAYDRDSWFMVFNLYPDRLLSLNTFSPRAHEVAAKQYRDARGTAGVSMGGDFRWAKTDWQLFCAADADDSETRNMFVDDLWAFLANGVNIEPFNDRYWVDDDVFNGIFHVAGTARQFRARPTIGAHFSILARDRGPSVKWDA